MFVRQYLLLSEERQTCGFVEICIKQYWNAMASGTFLTNYMITTNYS